ncbi:Alpha/Beta hydrolase protein [Baffinella frigidus]|nr:Alpha/Beta hydrolase protein [Cryptophyta sp. CCMP2293]
MYTLVLSRCPPPPETVSSHTHSVVLCHGFASNRSTFDLEPSVSVVDYLATNGWDTWVVELRGSGRSKNTGPINSTSHNWCFEDHVEDMRAIIEKVCTVSGNPVHVVGHSMGAMLVQCAAAGESGDRGMIRSGVSIAGSFLMSASEWKEFLWLWPVVQHFTTIHPEFIQEVLAPMSFRFNTHWDQLFFRSNNVDHNVAREMFRKNWEPIPVSLISQLRSAVGPSGLHSNDGTTAYADILPSIKTNMLLIAGSKDQQCPPVCMQTANLRIPNSTYKCFGVEHGNKHEYGHFDLIVGVNARTEVWDAISDFLVENDGDVPSTVDTHRNVG